MIGFNLAQRKPIWNDEILTQTAAIDKLSYGQIMLGIIKGEGNNHPLFYLIQKATCDLNHYRFPKAWEGEYLFSDPRSQMIMRIAPNIFMSLSVILLFYFFSSCYSWGVGLYTLLLAFSSSMTWIFWAEARPYSLWFFLSVVQSLLLLDVIRKRRFEPLVYRAFVMIHFLLALTAIVSILQIAVISILFWFLIKERRLASYIYLTFLPIGVSAFYYFQSSRFKLAMPSSWWNLIAPHLPPDRMVFFIIYVIFLLGYIMKTKTPAHPAVTAG